jgi:hypothetical protein
MPPNLTIAIGAAAVLILAIYSGRHALETIVAPFDACAVSGWSDAIACVRQLPDLAFFGLLGNIAIVLANVAGIAAALWLLISGMLRYLRRGIRQFLSRSVGLPRR